MSKHEKYVRRERRKTDRARRRRVQSSRNPKSAFRNGCGIPHRAATALAAAAAIAAGTQAYAEPVRFDNPAHGDLGHYHWPPFQAEDTRWIDPMVPATGQPATPNDLTSVMQWYSGLDGRLEGAYYGGAELEFDDSTDHKRLLFGLGAGDLIPSGAPFHYRVLTDHYGRPPHYPSLLPEGVETYLGVRFGAIDGTHYGWFGVVRTGHLLEAFAWGYETEPGVPIAAGGTPGSGDQPGDMNDDGAVTPEDIPAFVGALLGQPLPPGHVDRSDMTGEGDSDGKDIQPFVDKLLE